MVNQGQAYWYSYKTDRIYHAPDTHAYFVYDFKTKQVSSKKLNIFNIKKKEIKHILNGIENQSQILQELKEWIIDNGKAIRFGINTEKLYFQVDKISPKRIKCVKRAIKLLNPPDRELTIEDGGKMIKFKSIKKLMDKK